MALVRPLIKQVQLHTLAHKRSGSQSRPNDPGDVHVDRPEQPIEILENPDIVVGDPVRPGFKLVLEKIW